MVYLDAHADLKSPESSPSKNLHGMPLRAMLGDTNPAIRELMVSTLDPSQIVMVGTRDCDPPEWEYIEAHGMSVVRSAEVNDDPMAVVRALEAKGSERVYVHIDIDVVDPRDFTYQPVPAADGVHKERFIEALKAICVLGYTGMPDEKDSALDAIVEMGLALG